MLKSALFEHKASFFLKNLLMGRADMLTFKTFKSSHRRCSIKKGVPKNFAKFTGKHLCQSLFLNKVAGLSLIKEAVEQMFSCEICKIFKNTFFTKHLWATACKSSWSQFSLHSIILVAIWMFNMYSKTFIRFLDVNECETLNGGCEHLCKNNNGSYVCECNGGFFLDGNGKTCSGKFSMQTSICSNCPVLNGGFRFEKTVPILLSLP